MINHGSIEGFEPPPYPYDRLTPIKTVASSHDGGAVDLSVGVPYDPAPETVVQALASSGAERSYPPSIGTEEFRRAAAGWLNRLLELTSPLSADDVRATIGSKEFVAGLPHWLRLRTPKKDTVLYPSVSYPSYAMGATLAGCRAVPVRVDENWRLDMSSISDDDKNRALCLWVNSPANPTGALDDLEAIADWGAAHDVLVVSDECYIEFTWDEAPSSILATEAAQSTQDRYGGFLAVHSLSKRSNLAGARAGFYAGDQELLHYLGEVRKHAGFMPPGPTQAAGVAAFVDEQGVIEQKATYRSRMERLISLFGRFDIDVAMPGGGFYLWVPAPHGDAWAFTERLAADLGMIVSPGEFYGEAAKEYVRVAAVQPLEQLDLIERRM